MMYIKLLLSTPGAALEESSNRVMWLGEGGNGRMVWGVGGYSRGKGGSGGGGH